MNSEEIKAINKKLEEHEERIAKLEGLLSGKPPSNVKIKPVSIGEFIAEKKPKSDVEKTLVIGYYLEIMENEPTFNILDIEAMFRKAKEPVPNNINLCVHSNIRKRFIMEAEEKKDNLKAWSLTQTGIDYINSGLKKSN